MTSADQPIRVYDGQPGDVVFLRSLMEMAGIEVIAAGHFYGATGEIYVRRGDEAEARAIVEDFDAQRSTRRGDVLRGPWPTE